MVHLLTVLQMVGVFTNRNKTSSFKIFSATFLWLYYLIAIGLDSSHETTTDVSSVRDTLQLNPMPDSHDLDRGLLLSVQAIQVCSLK